MARDLRLSIQGDASSADKALATASAALDRANKELRTAEARTEALAVKARKLAEAEERAGDKTRDLAFKTAALRKQIAETGDETGDLGRKLDRLARDTKFAALATDDYRRAADRAAADAREQARAYDRVADNARQAARAVEHLGAASLLSPSGKGKGEGSALGGIAGGLGKVLGGASENLLGISSSAGEGLLGTPIVGPLALGAGAVGALGLATFAGASIGGGVLGGLGLGGAGLGIAGAVAGNPNHFKAEWSMAIDGVKKRWIDSSQAFTNELEDGLKVVDRTLRGLPVEKVLAVSQSFVPPLTLGAAGGATELASGLADGLSKAQPVVDEVGLGLAKIGHAGGDAFRIIAEGSKGGSAAIHDLFSAVSFGIRAVALLINGFEHLYDSIHSTVSSSLDFVKTVPVVGTVAESVYDKFIKVDNSTVHLARSLGDSEKSSNHLGRAWSDMARSGAEAAISATTLNDALTETMNTQLAMKDATIGVAQGWLDLKKELGSGARTLDLSSQEGINNQKVIADQIGMLERLREQQIKTGGGTVDAINSANAAYNANIEKLRQSAYAAGFNHQKVDELIASLNSVPPDVKSDVQVSGLSSSLDQGISLGNALNNIDGRSYHATVDVSYQEHNPGIALGNLLHHARGGTMPWDGASMVGEHGPEIAWLNRQQYVSTAEETRKLMSMTGGSSAGGSSPTPVALQVAGGADQGVGRLVQYLIDRGYIQAFAGGQLLTTRRS